MKKGLTELVFIIDKSGSMSGMESDTIGGFNSMIEKQKDETGEAYVSTVMFSNSSEVVHDRISIDKVSPLSAADYCVGGCTALLDAIGDAVHHIGNIHKYARPEDLPEHTLFIITTDGMENASHKYTSDQIKEKIRHQEKEYGWEFVFIAANIDAVETAGHIGIRPDRAANYCQDCEGTMSTYDSMCEVVSSVRRNVGIGKSKWKEKLKTEK